MGWSRAVAASALVAVLLVGATGGTCGERAPYPGANDGPASTAPAETAASRSEPAPAPKEAPPGLAREPVERLDPKLAPHADPVLWRVTMRQRGTPPQARVELVAASHPEEDGAVIKHVHRTRGRVLLETPPAVLSAPVTEPPPGLVVHHRTDPRGRLVSDVEQVEVSGHPLPWLTPVVARFLRLDPPVGAYGAVAVGATLRYARDDTLPLPEADAEGTASDGEATSAGEAPGDTTLPVRLRLEATVARVEDRPGVGRVAVLPVTGEIVDRRPAAVRGARSYGGTVRGEVAFSLTEGRVVARSWQLALRRRPRDAEPGDPDEADTLVFDQILVGTPIPLPEPEPDDAAPAAAAQ